MTATTPSFFTRIRHAVFGKPLTHEQAQAQRAAQVGTARGSASFENGARARSVQNQGYWF